MRTDALVQLADAAQERGYERSIQLLERALAEARGDDARVARIEEVLSRYCQVAGVYDDAREHARSALEAAERVGDERTVALTLATIAIRETVSALEPTPGLLERAVALEDAGLDARAVPESAQEIRAAADVRGPLGRGA